MNVQAGVLVLTIPLTWSVRPACRLLRWGASTAADAARLEQGWLEHRQDMQTQMGGATTSAELAQPPPGLGAAHQEHHTLQWQQQQGRTADAVKHWTLLESGQAQLRQAGHGYMATEGSNSDILNLLEDTAVATSETEILNAKMSLKMSSDVQSQPSQLRHGQELDAALLQPTPGAHSRHHRLQGGIAALQAPRLTQAADTAVAQGYAKAAGHMIGHANQQTLRHRQRAGTAQGKGRGHKGILSFAQLHTSRVAPEGATQDAAALDSQTCVHVLLTGPSHTEDTTTLPARAPDNIHARQQKVSCNQDRGRAARAMYRKPGRPMMHVALQQSMLQVKSCKPSWTRGMAVVCRQDPGICPSFDLDGRQEAWRQPFNVPFNCGSRLAVRSTSPCTLSCKVMVSPAKHCPTP